MLPDWIDKHLTPYEFKEIESLIRTIETQTDGEVLPVITQQSQDYRPFSFLVSLSILALIMPFFVFLSQKAIVSYLGFWILAVSTLLFLLLIVPQFINSGFFISLLSKLTNSKQVIQQKAVLEFHNQNIGKTYFKTGVLIFVSLMERQVVVLADQTINEKVDSGQWVKTVNAITNGIANKNLFEGLKNGLEECSQVLEREFPHTTAQANKLPDRLIVLKKY